jgi:hypothetical protein
MRGNSSEEGAWGDARGVSEEGRVSFVTRNLIYGTNSRKVVHGGELGLLGREDLPIP